MKGDKLSHSEILGKWNQSLTHADQLGLVLSNRIDLDLFVLRIKGETKEMFVTTSIKDIEVFLVGYSNKQL